MADRGRTAPGRRSCRAADAECDGACIVSAMITSATLVIYREDLDPSSVDARLAVTASSSWKHGEPIVTKRGRYGDHPTGGWLLSSELSIDASDLEPHLTWLLDRIGSRRGQLRELVDEGCDIGVRCVVSGSPGGNEMTISAATVRALAELEVPVDLAVYD
jgi:hypothetical protein